MHARESLSLASLPSPPSLLPIRSGVTLRAPSPSLSLLLGSELLWGGLEPPSPLSFLSLLFSCAPLSPPSPYLASSASVLSVLASVLSPMESGPLRLLLRRRQPLTLSPFFSSQLAAPLRSFSLALLSLMASLREASAALASPEALASPLKGEAFSVPSLLC